MKKKYYKISELKAMGYPATRIEELCRAGKIGIRSNTQAVRGWHWLVTIEEVEKYL